MPGFFLYIIEHKSSGKVYVGITKNPEARWKAHCDVANRGDTKHLYYAMKKYGVENFSFSVIETHDTNEELLDAEIWMIAYLRSLGATLYNMTSGGDGVCDPLPEVRVKMGVHRGKHLSEEHRKNLSKAGKGRVFSEETRRKLSESLKGRKVSDEERKRISERQKGVKRKPHSEETKRKMSEAAKNRGPEWSEKTSESLKNRTFSEEHRKNLSTAAKNRSDQHRKKLAKASAERIVSDETKQKLSEANRKRWQKWRENKAQSNEEDIYDVNAAREKN